MIWACSKISSLCAVTGAAWPVHPPAGSNSRLCLAVLAVLAGRRAGSGSPATRRGAALPNFAARMMGRRARPPLSYKLLPHFARPLPLPHSLLSHTVLSCASAFLLPPKFRPVSAPSPHIHHCRISCFPQLLAHAFCRASLRLKTAMLSSFKPCIATGAPRRRHACSLPTIANHHHRPPLATPESTRQRAQ